MLGGVGTEHDLILHQPARIMDIQTCAACLLQLGTKWTCDQIEAVPQQELLLGILSNSSSITKVLTSQPDSHRNGGGNDVPGPTRFNHVLHELAQEQVIVEAYRAHLLRDGLR